MNPSKEYQAGYRAGQRRQTAKDKEEARAAFWRACYVAAIDSAMRGSWSVGSVAQTNITQRSEIAMRMADESLLRARERGMV